VRAVTPVHRRAAERVGAYALDRHPDFFDRVGVGRGLLRLRATRIAPAHVDETDASAAMLARAGHWTFAQQRPRSPRGDLQPPVGFYSDAEVRDRAQIAILAKLQISRFEIDVTDRRAGLRNLFQLLRLVCPKQGTVLVGTVSADVSRRLSLCGTLVASALVAETQFWPFPGRISNYRVTKRDF
jgi:hypothetical protein